MEITSETFHEDWLYIWQYYNDILVERVVSILHIVLTYNESLQRGGKSNQNGNTGAKEPGLQRADPLRVMTQEAMRAWKKFKKLIV